MIQVGDIAPDFALRTQTGEEARLVDVLERGPAVVFFYLRDATPG